MVSVVIIVESARVASRAWAPWSAIRHGLGAGSMEHEGDNSLSQASAKGKIKWFNGTKGYGFVTLDNGGDAFCHASVLQAAGHQELQPGVSIVCDLADSSARHAGGGDPQRGIFPPLRRLPHARRGVKASAAAADAMAVAVIASAAATGLVEAATASVAAAATRMAAVIATMVRLCGPDDRRQDQVLQRPERLRLWSLPFGPRVRATSIFTHPRSGAQAYRWSSRSSGFVSRHVRVTKVWKWTGSNLFSGNQMRGWPLSGVFVLAALVMASSSAVAESESHCATPDGVTNVAKLSALPVRLQTALKDSYPDLQSRDDTGQPRAFLQGFHKGEVWAIAYSYCDRCRVSTDMVVVLRLHQGSMFGAPPKKIASGNVCAELGRTVSAP